MSSSEIKYNKDKNLSDAVTKTKVSHGKIETAIRVRNAKSKNELDLEFQRLNILNEIDKSTFASEIVIPKELKRYQQLILIIGNLSLKSATEICLACKKLGYTGALNKKRILSLMQDKSLKKYFRYDGMRWTLTSEGQTEFSRLKQFL